MVFTFSFRRNEHFLIDHYAKFERKVPLVAVPSSYNQVTEEELHKRGVNIVIYANMQHMYDRAN